MLPSLLVRSRARYGLLLALTVASTLAVAASCATGAQTTHVFESADSGSQPGSGDAAAPNFGDGAGPTFPGTDSGAGSDGSCGSGCTDFPSAPVNDPLGTVPGDPTSLFPGDGGTDTTTGGPCLTEPANGTLYPYNWLRPRVLWASSTAQTIFEVRISAPGETNDYVVYTTNHFWTLDQATWVKIAGTEGGATGTLVGVPISVVVRATSTAGGTPAISNTAVIEIAPAIADGSLIFWTTANHDNSATSTSLNGFHVGDTGTTLVLSSAQVVQPVVASPVDGGNTTSQPVGVFCIGCHTATPDGNYVAFTAQWPWANAIASPQAATVGQQPPWLTAGAIANMSPVAGPANGNTNWFEPPQINQVMLGIQTFSGGDGVNNFGHYQTGDRIVVTTLGAAENATSIEAGTTKTGVIPSLAWINLEYGGVVPTDGGLPLAPCTTTTAGCLPPQTPNGGWGLLAHNGDLGTAGAPSWSHNLDGKTDVIAYTSTPSGTKDGRMNDGPADIYTVQYNSLGAGLGGSGGTAMALPGASAAGVNEYYPAFSPDDSLVAFNSVPSTATMYNQPLAEVYVVPYNAGAGGTPVRLAANDPVACTGLKSPGVQNTWPKWAPNPIPPGDAGVPAPQTIDGNTYYWVTFSSNRATYAVTPDGTLAQQLYVAGVVVDSMGGIHTYAPIYLWNQDDTVNNLIPAWSEFSIPPGLVTPPPPPPPPPPK